VFYILLRRNSVFKGLTKLRHNHALSDSSRSPHICACFYGKVFIDFTRTFHPHILKLVKNAEVTGKSKEQEVELLVHAIGSSVQHHLFFSTS
jgi:hypothetical protein